MSNAGNVNEWLSRTSVASREMFIAGIHVHQCDGRGVPGMEYRRWLRAFPSGMAIVIEPVCSFHRRPFGPIVTSVIFPHLSRSIVLCYVSMPPPHVM